MTKDGPVWLVLSPLFMVWRNFAKLTESAASQTRAFSLWTLAMEDRSGSMSVGIRQTGAHCTSQCLPSHLGLQRTDHASLLPSTVCGMVVTIMPDATTRILWMTKTFSESWEIVVIDAVEDEGLAGPPHRGDRPHPPQRGASMEFATTERDRSHHRGRKPGASLQVSGMRYAHVTNHHGQDLNLRTSTSPI